MNRTPVSVALAALFAGVAHAQSPSERSAELAPVVVTANPLESSLFDLAPSATVLEGQRLRLRAQSTLGETLGTEPGVTSTYFGPNASRPIIRGLDGDRIRILQNGVGMLDASAASFDHAVSVEPLLIDRAEIVRGPATLMYGGNAVGGVVNVVDGRIARERFRGVTGAVEARYGSAASERTQVGRVDVGNGQLMLHADVFRRHTGDLRVPDYVRSARLRERSPLPADEEPRGRIPNSASLSDGAGVGASAVWDKGYTGVAASQYNSRYGTVAEPDVKIGLQQRRYELAGEIREIGSFVQALRYKSAYSDYQHIEYEDTQPGTTFNANGHNSRVELLHAPIGPMKGAFGLELQNFRFAALGDEAFLPRTRTQAVDAFIYEEIQLGALKLSGGGRLDRVDVRSSDDPAFGPSERRKFSPRSGAFGAVYALPQGYAVALQTSYTERAPTYQELFANGAHIATNAVEIGDASLRKERSQGVGVSLRKRTGVVTGAVGAFYNRFRNFVALTDTGAIDERDPADPDDDLPIFAYRAVPAEFRGVEADAQWRAYEGAAGRLVLELRGDYTRAKNRDTGEPLPRIAPMRIGGAIAFQRGGLSARLDLLRAARQSRTATNELPTDGYTMVNATIAHRLRVVRTEFEVFLRGVNLLNEEARLHTSFLKDIAPLGKRGVVLGVRAGFCALGAVS